MDRDQILSLITRRHRQLLVHSFLYYILDSSIVPDSTWDAWRRECAELHRKYPDIARQAPYYDICKGFQDSPSGYWIREKDYPEEIVATALRLLYYHLRLHGDNPGSFEEFLLRRGYKILN